MYVLMITPNKFPNEDAGAVRDNYFGKIYQKLGYRVVHIGMGMNAKRGTYNEIKFYSLYRKNESFFEKLTNLLSYQKRLESMYLEIVKNYGLPSIIHIYDIPASGIKWAKKIAIKEKIQIIHDSVEWYSPCEFKLRRLAYPYFLKNRTNTRLIDKPIDVIAISTFLEEHFKEKGLKTIRIPVIMDSEEYKPETRKEGEVIRLVYAGSPAKKDYLKECVQAFCRMETSEQKKFEFNIFGASQSLVDQYCDNKAPKEIIAHGRVSRETVINFLAKSDFSLLLRPENERYAKAGFPTKSVEALMNGCAMICNLTSDLGLYLINGYNSIIVDGFTVDAMNKSLKIVAKLSHDELCKLRKNARKTAENNFDYRIYTKKVEKFLNE